jgi:hypothetical protein
MLRESLFLGLRLRCGLVVRRLFPVAVDIRPHRGDNTIARFIYVFDFDDILIL